MRDVEYRFGDNSAERLPEFATELARLNVSVVVAFREFAVRAVQRAAPDTPIVFLMSDPISAGLVTNPSRPGGNITGVLTLRAAGKWPELAKQLLPGLTRVGYLINPTNAGSVASLNALRLQFCPPVARGRGGVVAYCSAQCAADAKSGAPPVAQRGGAARAFGREAMNTVCRRVFPCSRGGNGQAFKGATRLGSGSCTRPSQEGFDHCAGETEQATTLMVNACRREGGA